MLGCDVAFHCFPLACGAARGLGVFGLFLRAALEGGLPLRHGLQSSYVRDLPFLSENFVILSFGVGLAGTARCIAVRAIRPVYALSRRHSTGVANQL